MATSDQVGTRWRTSSYSTGGGNDGDSKSPTTGTLVLPPAAWSHFLAEVSSPST